MEEPRRITLNGRRMRDRDSAYRYLKRKLRLRGGCGKNLDALHDVLSEPRFHAEITLTRTDRLFRSMGEYGQRFIDMMADTAGENPNLVFRVENDR